MDVENLYEEIINGCPQSDTMEYRVRVPVPNGIQASDTLSNMVRMEYAVYVCICFF